MEQASDLFMDLVCNQGTPSATCQLCGRSHFASGSGSYNSDEEIQRWRESAEKEPDKWCEVSEDGLAFGHINGIQVVYDCPCHKLRKYEDFIWSHRSLIINYIRQRTANELAEAQRMADEIRSSF